jgi:hypothetical protein
MSIQVRINHLAELVPDIGNVACAEELEALQQFCDPFLLFVMLHVSSEHNSLNDSAYSSLEVLRVVSVLIAPTSVVARIRHFQKPVQQTTCDLLTSVSWMNVDFELKGVAIHARLVTVVIERCISDDLLADVGLRFSGLIASTNRDQEGQTSFDDGVDTIANLLVSALFKLVGVDGGLNVVVVDILRLC